MNHNRDVMILKELKEYESIHLEESFESMILLRWIDIHLKQQGALAQNMNLVFVFGVVCNILENKRAFIDSMNISLSQIFSFLYFYNTKY